MIKLYDVPLSGNCHKVRLMLSMLGLKYETVPVDLQKREQKSPQYLAMNPLGQVPTLDDDGTIVWDSHAILVYLARKYGDSDWYPENPHEQTEIQSWLAFSAKEMIVGPAVARAIVVFKRTMDPETAKAAAVAALEILDGWLETHDWLACDRPTIADIAVYPYAAMAWEGGVDMGPYDDLNEWIRRVEALPGYVGMKNLPRPT